ncbi:MAG TPA: hypothetical protein PLO25_02765 [Candidatus Saccharibacteria bacterium]|nr:hypothetical protein [Candidatus Saccharibacteria bacterium]
MAKKHQIQAINTIGTSSKLERFSLSFEYDKTLKEVKREMRIRTLM